MILRSDVNSSEASANSRMPESPSAVKQQLLAAPSSGRSSVPIAAHKTASGMNGAHSPHSSTPSGRTPSPPGGAHANPIPLPTTAPSSVSSSSELSLGSNIRQVGKLKRFLTTLQQFGVELPSDSAERMHNLIINLVSSVISIEEFHQKVQDLTNYSFRPFAIPFLKTSLPLLQAELLHFARVAKQTPQQYIRQHEQVIMDPGAHPGGEPFEIFQTETKETTKRRTSPEIRSRENGYSENSSDGPPPAKRQQTLPSPTLGARLSPAGSGNHLPPSLNFRFEEGIFRDRDRYERYERYDREICRPYYGSNVHRDFPEDRDMEDEWKNIHTMLNCILGMVEKTKRALAILQHRSYAERQDNIALWRSTRHMDGTEFDLKKRAADLLQHPPSHHHYKPQAQTEERVCDVRRRPEAVTQRQPTLLPLPDDNAHEVKRHAVVELHKAVSAAENKASELLAAERVKMERMLSDARRQAAEETMAAINHQEESTESCWNCGRKANETCSGCNQARYCGAFCQHKDWENHHKVCGQGAAVSASTTPTTTTSHVSPATTPPAIGGKQSPRPLSARTVQSETKVECKN